MVDHGTLNICQSKNNEYALKISLILTFEEHGQPRFTMVYEKSYFSVFLRPSKKESITVNKIYETKCKALEILYGYMNGIERPFENSKGGDRINSAFGYDDYPILMTLLIVPYASLNMLNDVLKEFNPNANVSSHTRKIMNRYILNDQTTRYFFGDKSYTKLAEEVAMKYGTAKEKLYCLTDNGAKVLFLLREKFENAANANAEAIRKLPKLSPEEIAYLRTMNKRKSCADHSVSVSWAFIKICCLLNHVYDEIDVDPMLYSSSRELMDLLRTECYISRTFERHEYGSDNLDKIDLCEKKPDLSFAYRCDSRTWTPVLIEIDQGSEGNQDIYDKVLAEGQYFIRLFHGTTNPPVILIGQFMNVLLPRKKKGGENADDRRYLSLMKSDKVRGTLSAFADCDCFKQLETAARRGDSANPNYLSDLLFAADYFRDHNETEITVESLNGEYRRIDAGIREQSSALRSAAMAETAYYRLRNLKKYDIEFGDYELENVLTQGAAVAACGKDDFSDACKTLLPFYFLTRQTQELALYLNSPFPDNQTYRTVPVLPVYEQNGRYPLLMRNGMFMTCRVYEDDCSYNKYRDGVVRKFCFEDLSHDLGAVIRLREYVLLPSFLTKGMTAVFIVDDDERLADGRYLKDYKFWRPNDDSNDDGYLDGFFAAYGNDVKELPFVNHETNDFVFIHKSEMLSLDIYRENPRVFLRFGNKVIERKECFDEYGYYDFKGLRNIYAYCTPIPDDYNPY